VPKTQSDMVNPMMRSVNLLEGRELLSPQAVAVDTSATGPILYVADTGNRRVLGFRNPGSVISLQQADFVIGQRDMFSSWPNTPGQGAPSYGSGLAEPTGLAVDRQGNLFVLDFANHRILRYPKPSEQTGVITADLVIGQPNLNSRNPNQSTAANAAPRADTLRFATAIQGQEYAAIAFDPEGNLWVTDNGNHRVLRYAASDVSGPSNVTTPRTISANYVLGQTDFVTATANPGRATGTAATGDILNKTKLRFGSALAFDSRGNLYVADDIGRVLYWAAGFNSGNLGRAADRILGIYAPQPGETFLAVNDFGLFGGVSGTTFAFGPKGLTVIEDRLVVSDTNTNRIVRYAPPSQWPAETATSISPRMTGVTGQADLFSGRPNRGAAEPAGDTLHWPAGLAADPASQRLYVADSLNHRVLAIPYEPGSLATLPASAVFGQVGFEFRAPNFIEGREFAAGSISFASGNNVVSVALGPHAALDYTSTPPRLYIADTLNNRVLGYANARRFSPGAKADLVIGQVDFYRNLVNSPSNDPAAPNEAGLNAPSSVAVDTEGHLYVADTNNGRVLRFPRPFEQEGQPRADLVLGQRDFTSREFEPSERTLFRPVSIALTGNDSLVVSDIAHNRVLLFARGDFSNGAAAARVLGQLDFAASAAGNLPNRFNLPAQVAVDADDNLYVADLGNNRLQIFYRVSAIDDGNGVDASNTLRLQNTSITGVAASKRRSQFWVIDSGTTTTAPRAIRVDRDAFLFFGTVNIDAAISGFLPRSLVLDERDNPILLDGMGRATFHYPTLSVVNWANRFARIAPAMIGTLAVSGVALNGSGTEVAGPAVPMEMDDYELFVASQRAPIIQVNQDDARVIIPKGAPAAGEAEFLLRRVSTGEIVGHASLRMTAVSPGVIVETPGAPATPAVAFNEDGSRNAAVSRARVGSTVTVYLTGQGAFDGLPEDGLSSEAEVPIAGSLSLLLFASTNPSTGIPVSSANIVSSTLDPQRPGVWRLRFRIPEVPATGDYWFGVVYKNVASYLTPLANPPAGQVRPVLFVTR